MCALLYSFDQSQIPRRPISIGSSSSSLSASTNLEGEKESSVVDLTADSDREIVDLTSPNANTTEKVKQREVISVSESEDSDVVILPCTPPQSHHQLPTPKPHSSSSPDITCPICMDNRRTFVASGRTLVTTKCGHIFCDSCLQKSITLLHKCPTCSGKLTLKQYHRIYI